MHSFRYMCFHHSHQVESKPVLCNRLTRLNRDVWPYLSSSCLTDTRDGMFRFTSFPISHGYSFDTCARGSPPRVISHPLQDSVSRC